MNDSAKTRPRLTIGLPVYNGARFLRAALDSLLGQTFTDFELIISDNASTDETQSIAESYTQRDARIVYVRHPRNQGAASNFNFVVERASGEYFKWAAADDLCAATFLERCVDVLDRDPSVVCCHARTCKIDENGQMLTDLDDPTDGGLPTDWFVGSSTGKVHRPDASSLSASRRFADIVLHSGWAARSYGVFRLSALKKTSLMLPYYGSEKLTMAQLALRGRFHDVPEALFFQRVHSGASSQLKTGRGRQQYITGSESGRKSPRLQLLKGYLQTIAASELGFAERARCCLWLLRYVFQLNKWPMILSAAIQRKEAGSANKPTSARPLAPAATMPGDLSTAHRS